MSTEGGGGDKASKQTKDEATAGKKQQQLIAKSTKSEEVSLGQTNPKDEPSLQSTGQPMQSRPATREEEEDSKPAARSTEQPPQVEATSGSDVASKPRQVIAVSASKGPAAFFNLARKFLVTDEMCDLSALEGAIVSAVDAAHLLERSKLATIVRVHTSYVTVEPKRKKQQPQPAESLGSEAPQGQQSLVASISSVAAPVAAAATAPAIGASTSGTRQAAHLQHPASIPPAGPQKSGKGSASGGKERELRRARIVITVRRTEEYRRWLEQNPLQAIIAGDVDDDENVEPESTPAAAAAPALTRKPP